jgi:C-methyltransferase C-terminal domain/Putative zinc binding domain/Methyltransferase domain
MLTAPELPLRPALLANPTCRLCGARLHRTVLDLGRMALASGTRAPGDRDTPHPLHIRVCDSCLLVQVQDPVAAKPHAALPPTGAAQDQARRLSQALCHRMGLGVTSLVVEIGCRGPRLAPFFAQAGIPVVTETAAFNAASAMDLAVRAGRADVVLANDVLPLVPDLFDFAAGFTALLRPKGILVLQVPHLLPVVQKVQFDVFRHDRPSYLSLCVIEQLLRSVGLRVFDAERLPDHGGSLRVYACHPRAPHATRPALKAIRHAETGAGLDHADSYAGYARRVEAAVDDVRDFLANRRAAGRRVAALGLATRGTALLNAGGITAAEIAWVADPAGRTTRAVLPGCGIQVVGPEALLEDRPSDLLILPWTRAPDLAAGLLPLRQKGTQFWVMIPAIRRV